MNVWAWPATAETDGNQERKQNKKRLQFPEPHDLSFIERNEVRSFVMACQTELTATDVDDQAVRRRSRSTLRLVDVVAGGAFDVLVGQAG